MGNAALPMLGLLRGEDEGVEGLKAERLTRFGGWGCGGERARARRSGGGNGGLILCFERERGGRSE
jgi:hypothetical protein